MATSGNIMKRRTVKSGLTSIQKPQLYFSGTRKFSGKSEADLIKLTGWRNRCFSFAYLDRNYKTFSREHYTAWEASLNAGVDWFLDSGAFTFQYTLKTAGPQELDSYLDGYAAFVRQYKPAWFVNFDYVKDARTVLTVQRKLEKRGLKPVPVYHGDDSLDYLRKYLDGGCTRIGISKPSHVTICSHDKLYDRVFHVLQSYPKVQSHGFGVTGRRIFNYPWDSVDSTSWLKAAIRGCIILVDSRRSLMNVFHVGTEREGGLWKKHVGHMAHEVQEQIKQQAERYAIPWAGLQGSIMWRSVFNAKSYNEGLGGNLLKGNHEWTNLL